MLFIMLPASRLYQNRFDEVVFAFDSLLLSRDVGKKKSTIPHEECWWGAHLPYLGREPVGGRFGRELNSRPLESQADALTVTSPGHTHGCRPLVNDRIKQQSRL